MSVCDKFMRTFHDGQHCYKVDVNELKDEVDKKKMASDGIALLLDYNFDRMVNFEGGGSSLLKDSSILKGKDESEEEAMIYIETLGKNKTLLISISLN